MAKNATEMTVLYTARGTFDPHYASHGMSWNEYLIWSKLTHLTELVSMDSILNELLVESDYDNPADWDQIVLDNICQTGFFKSLDYVLQKTRPQERFNLLAIVVEPVQDWCNLELDNFEFMGYDLLDKAYGTSALTNCGGFDETFSPAHLNKRGLLDDYEKAFDIKKELLTNHPEEHHANTNVIAVWRHLNIGR